LLDITYYLARHAAPVLGWPAPYNVSPGPPLSDLGRRQAAELAGFLAAQGVMAVYASPFARAQETAEAIAARAGCRPALWPDLSEGAPGEGEDALRTRVLRGWQTIRETEHPGPVAIVAHGSPVKAILHSLNDGRVDLSQYVFDYDNPLPPGGAWCAQWQDERWDLALVFQPAETLREWELTRGGQVFGAPLGT
jgi:broad specificity phosphatase PhoE